MINNDENQKIPEEKDRLMQNKEFIDLIADKNQLNQQINQRRMNQFKSNIVGS